MARKQVTAESSTQTKSRRSWAPDRDDHFIYWWIKQGQTQSSAANLLGISQGTISRTLQRYERWQTRAEAQQDGRLSHAERLRAQRWLTYERNELILASCLRIAGEMEGFVDVSRSVVQRPLSQPQAERELRTTHSTQDRHGLAARFLRLAYRINMDNLKLVEQDELPPLDPLTPEQLAAEEDAAEQLRSEREASRRDGRSYYDEQQERARQQQAEIEEENRQLREQRAEFDRLQQVEASERQALAAELARQESAAEAAEDDTAVPSYQVSTNPPAADAPAATESAESAHNAHNDAPANSVATQGAASTYATNRRPGKTPRHARMNGSAKRRQSSPPTPEPVTELRLSPDQIAAAVR